MREIEIRTQEVFEAQFGKAKISFHFDELDVVNFLKNAKIRVDDGLETYLEEKGSGMQRSVALALIQVYAERLVNHPDHEIDKPFFLVIDEPEICLHPKAQLKLLEALLKISRDRQVFIATHSPYMFKNDRLQHIGLFMCTHDVKGISVRRAEAGTDGLLPWSPSWPEVNYRAYNLPTVEFHNELYGHLQDRTKLGECNAFDSYLQSSQGINNVREYKQEGRPERAVTLCTYVRHQINHPDNNANPRFTIQDLRESIELLISVHRRVSKSFAP